MISHGLALMVIIAISIALAMSVIWFCLSVWSDLPRRAQEVVEVLGDSYYSYTTSTLYLHLYTNYKPYAVIYRIELFNRILNLSEAKIVKIENGRAEIRDGKLVLWAGTRAWIAIPISSYIPSITYLEVKVYTEQGYVYRGIVTVKS